MFRSVSYMKNNRTRIAVSVFFIVIFLFAMATVCSAEEKAAQVAAVLDKSPFKDIGVSNYYYPYAKFLQSQNILSGFPDGTFRPSTDLTRAQVAVTLVKAIGLGEAAAGAGDNRLFSDVAASHWAYRQVQTAANAGLLKGDPGGKFRPDDYITRAEAAVLLIKYSKEPETEYSPVNLADVPEAYWAHNYIATAVDGYILGTDADKKFKPDNPLNRAEWARGLTLVMNLSPALRQVPLTAMLIVKEPGVQIISAGKTLTPAKGDKIPLNINDQILTGTGTAEIVCDDGSGLRLEKDTDVVMKEKRGYSYLMPNGSRGVGVDYLEIKVNKGKMFAFLATRIETGTAATKEVQKSGKEEKASPAADIKGPVLVASNQSFYELLAANETAKKLPWYQTANAKRVRVKVDMPWGVAAVRGTTIYVEVKPSGESSVGCFRGEVVVTTNASGEVVVQKGQATFITGKDAPVQPPQELTEEQRQVFEKAFDWFVERLKEQLAKQSIKVEVPPEYVPENQQEYKQQDIDQILQDTINQVVDQIVAETISDINITIGNDSNSGGNDSDSPSIVSFNGLKQSVALGSPGSVYTLPAKITAIMSNGTTKEVSVAWTIPEFDISIAGVYSIPGTVDGYGTIQFILCVEAPLGSTVEIQQGVPLAFAGGIFIDLGNLSVPPGATLKVFEPDSIPEDPGMEIAGKVLEFEFAGITFDIPVAITFPLNDGVDESTVGIFHWLEDENVWQYQPSVIEDGVISAYVSSFSIYGVFDAEKVAALEATPEPGSVQVGATVTLTADTDANIYYTINGSEPTYNSNIYEGPIEITGPSTIKAFASKYNMINSDTAVFAYSTTGNMNFSGRILDVDGNGVSGITIKFREGVDTTEGPVVGTAETDENGYYTISLPVGQYTGELSGTGYLTTYFLAGGNGTVIRAPEAGDTKIMLTWGENPHDLDSHLIGPALVGPAPDGSLFHIYYGNKVYEYNGTVYVDLDLDDTSSYGPETTSIYNYVDGKYRFYVKNFSGDGTLRYSGAKVEVYKGGLVTPVKVYNVEPGDGSESFWTVFDIIVSGSEITFEDVNQYYDNENDAQGVVSGNPVITERSPADDAENVDFDAPVQAVFNQYVNENEQIIAGVSISGQKFGLVGNVSAGIEDDKLIITHDAFASGENYTVHIPAGSVISSENGMSNADIYWSFTTKSDTVIQAVYASADGTPSGMPLQGSDIDGFTVYCPPASDYIVIAFNGTITWHDGITYSSGESLYSLSVQGSVYSPAAPVYGQNYIPVKISDSPPVPGCYRIDIPNLQIEGLERRTVTVYLIYGIN
ncbi:MAG: hypothetical protein VR69_14975 [Peptococcaceae bacterium BRH_c4b]|nr:MAG: hypothetical protein VR69_14975 [Peptococcaceae bacterium BRH_c4b]